MTDPFHDWPESGALAKCPDCSHWTYDAAWDICCECQPYWAHLILAQGEARIPGRDAHKGGAGDATAAPEHDKGAA